MFISILKNGSLDHCIVASGLTPWQIWEGLVGELVDLVDHFRQVVVKFVTIHEVFEGRDLVVRDFPLPLEPVSRESSKFLIVELFEKSGKDADSPQTDENM